MYLIIGENKRTSERRVVAKHKNLVVCLKEIARLNAVYGTTERFLWRSSADAII